MSASWDGRPGIVPARHIRPATDWSKVVAWLGIVGFSVAVWLGVGLLAWWAS